VEPKVPSAPLRAACGRINIGDPNFQEVAMAKGQMRTVKEKKKPKADKDKPKQLSPYKLAQMQGTAGNPFGNPPKKS
jgi:hypothetical protein